jgi:hypothetical protein
MSRTGTLTSASVLPLDSARVRPFRRRETLNEQLLRETEAAHAAREQQPGKASLDAASDEPSLEPSSRGADQEWEDWWMSWGRSDLRRILIEEWGPTEAATGAEYEEDLDLLGAQLRDGSWSESVASYLNEADEKRTGTGPTTASRARNRALAARLRTWHDKEIAARTGQLDDSIWKDLLRGLAGVAGWFSDLWPA